MESAPLTRVAFAQVVAALEKLPEHQPALQKTEAEWKLLLSPEEYRIIRGKGTEPAGSGEYDRFFPEKKEGFFACRACEQVRRPWFRIRMAFLHHLYPSCATAALLSLGQV